MAKREAEVFGGLVLKTTAVIATYEITELTTILDFPQRVRDVTAQDADHLSERAAADGAAG